MLSAEARRALSLLEGGPLAGKDIAQDGRGRPFFPARDADFSITHSGALAAVSLARGARTGCDAELVRPRTRAAEIADSFFSVSEREYIFSGRGCKHKKFYQIWTLKECFLKLKGLSVFDMAKVPSFIHEGDFAFSGAAASPLAFYLYELGDADDCYVLAAAFEGTARERPEVKWFSHYSLPCKSIAKINAPLNPAETVRPKM
ncbi:MAG: 4'-phosphopantetheinyl transferase superfamily protein [Treponema sp.]|nr:4'-phosphopantetheinyl transferase superfamily protein [Treponema sp.]